MTVPILIPARGGSRRVPRKNIRDLCGRPLLAWSIKTAFQADVGPVYVSTEDEEIAGVAHEYGAQLFLRRQDAATDEAPMSMVVNEFMSGIGADRVLLLQPTSPVRSADTVARAARAVNNGERAFSVRRALVAEGCGGDRPTRPLREMKPGVYRVPTVFGYQRWGDARTALLFVQPWEAIDIDTEDDFALAEFWMKRKGWFWCSSSS